MPRSESRLPPGTPDGKWLGGFFDRGSFSETMANWGKSIVPRGAPGPAGEGNLRGGGGGVIPSIKWTQPIHALLIQMNIANTNRSTSPQLCFLGTVMQKPSAASWSPGAP